MKSLKRQIGPVFCLLLLLAVTGCATVLTPAQQAERGKEWTLSEITIEFGGEDPCEGFNRTMFGIQQFCGEYILRPIGMVYASIVPTWVQKRVVNAFDNLKFPVRALSAALQGKGGDAGVDTARFFINSTLGLGGLFDVADSWWGLKDSGENMAQVLQYYGMGRGPTLLLPYPVVSNLRDGVGYCLDYPLDVANYLDYIDVWGLSYTGSINRLTVNYRVYDSLLHNNADPYEFYKLFMIFAGEMAYQDVLKSAIDQHMGYIQALKSGMMLTVPPQVETPKPDWVTGRYVALKDYRSEHPELNTMRSALFAPQTDAQSWWSPVLSIWNSDWTGIARNPSLPVLPERPKMDYYHWPQKADPGAPLVIVLPGIGSHYTTSSALALAELCFYNGYQTATLSNACNWQFIESASTHNYPGYTPLDVADVHWALSMVVRDVIKANNGVKPRSMVLMGYSLGGLHTLHLAAKENIPGNELHFDRYVAINPPMNLLYALGKTDSFGAVSKNWTRAEARENVMKALTEYLAMIGMVHPYYDHSQALLGAPGIPADFYRTNMTVEQAQFLVWVSFKLAMRDVLYMSAKKNVIIPGLPDYRWNHRTELYRAIDAVSFKSYVQEYLGRELRTNRPDPQSRDALALLQDESGLYEILAQLSANPKVRVLHNLDDFLLDKADQKQLDQALGDRIVWFDHGGHLGNLYMVKLHNYLLAEIAYGGRAKPIFIGENAWFDAKKLRTALSIGNLDGSLRQDWLGQIVTMGGFPAPVAWQTGAGVPDVLVSSAGSESGDDLELRAQKIVELRKLRHPDGALPRLALLPEQGSSQDNLWQMQLLCCGVNNYLKQELCRLASPLAQFAPATPDAAALAKALWTYKLIYGAQAPVPTAAALGAQLGLPEAVAAAALSTL